MNISAKHRRIDEIRPQKIQFKLTADFIYYDVTK